MNIDLSKMGDGFNIGYLKQNSPPHLPDVQPLLGPKRIKVLQKYIKVRTPYKIDSYYITVYKIVSLLQGNKRP